MRTPLLKIRHFVLLLVIEVAIYFVSDFILGLLNCTFETIRGLVLASPSV